ncbi:MAG: hypothetical protein ACREBR_03980 [bacterium]
MASELRWLAGGQYNNICIIFGIGSTTCYDCIWRVAGAIDKVEKFDFPTDDVNKMKTTSKEFGKRSGGVMDGCIGALDGLRVRTRAPKFSETSYPAQYMNRKGFSHHRAESLTLNK